MKKIIPFNNVLKFNTDIREVTAISLEHEINKEKDLISGIFYISGEYKITDGQLEKEPFNFELPFDIALSKNYNLDTLLVDIDDFRYDIISDKELKVNIDLYVDGEEIEEPTPRDTYIEELPEENINIRELTNEILSAIPKEENLPEEEIIESKEIEVLPEPERVELLKDMLTNEEENMKEDLNIDIDNKNISNNIFNPNQEDEYVTYRVYKVLDNDTLESILTKYNITKEKLSEYNNVENIIPGDKLIIPTNEE